MGGWAGGEGCWWVGCCCEVTRFRHQAGACAGVVYVRVPGMRHAAMRLPTRLPGRGEATTRRARPGKTPACTLSSRASAACGTPGAPIKRRGHARPTGMRSRSAPAHPRLTVVGMLCLRLLLVLQEGAGRRRGVRARLEHVARMMLPGHRLHGHVHRRAALHVGRRHHPAATGRRYAVEASRHHHLHVGADVGYVLLPGHAARPIRVEPHGAVPLRAAIAVGGVIAGALVLATATEGPRVHPAELSRRDISHPRSCRACTAAGPDVAARRQRALRFLRPRSGLSLAFPARAGADRGSPTRACWGRARCAHVQADAARLEPRRATRRDGRRDARSLRAGRKWVCRVWCDGAGCGCVDVESRDVSPRDSCFQPRYVSCSSPRQPLQKKKQHPLAITHLTQSRGEIGVWEGREVLGGWDAVGSLPKARRPHSAPAATRRGARRGCPAQHGFWGSSGYRVLGRGHKIAPPRGRQRDNQRG